MVKKSYLEVFPTLPEVAKHDNFFLNIFSFLDWYLSCWSICNTTPYSATFRKTIKGENLFKYQFIIKWKCFNWTTLLELFHFNQLFSLFHLTFFTWNTSLLHKLEQFQRNHPTWTTSLEFLHFIFFTCTTPKYFHHLTYLNYFILISLELLRLHYIIWNASFKQLLFNYFTFTLPWYTFLELLYLFLMQNKGQPIYLTLISYFLFFWKS